MTLPQFIRWANQREKAADALHEARRWISQMIRMGADVNAGPWTVRSIGLVNASIGEALAELAKALDHATSETKGNS